LKHSRDKALTLVELIVALAIAAAVTAAALRVTVGLSRSSRRIASQDALELTDGLSKVLATDLGHADRYRATREGFELDSAASIDPKTHELRHGRCKVAYQIARIDQRACLLRKQTPDPAARSCTELIAVGIRAIRLYETGHEPTGHEQSSHDLWRPLTERMTVTVTPQDPSRANVKLQLELP